MRIGVVGAGSVGSTAAFAFVMRGLASRLTLVDSDRDRAGDHALDVARATAFAHPARIGAGEVADLEGSDLVVLAAGAGASRDRSRLELAAHNAELFRELVPRVADAAPQALLLVASEPVDVLTQVTFETSGLPEARVIGSGTALDSARLRSTIARRTGVATDHVHGYVLGEHGDEPVVAWSGVRVAGRPPDEVMLAAGRPWGPEQRAEIERELRDPAAQRRGAVRFGLAAALTRIVAAIAEDEHAVLTVSVSDGSVAYSLPRVLGRTGLVRTLDPHLDAAERAALTASGEVIRDVLDRLR